MRETHRDRRKRRSLASGAASPDRFGREGSVVATSSLPRLSSSATLEVAAGVAASVWKGLESFAPAAVFTLYIVFSATPVVARAKLLPVLTLSAVSSRHKLLQ